MRSDLQSVKRVPSSTFARAFAPKMSENVRYWFSSPQNGSNFSSSERPSKAVSRFPGGAVARNHRQHFFRSNWVKYDFDRGRIENNKVLTVIFCNWDPGEKREATLI